MASNVLKRDGVSILLQRSGKTLLHGRAEPPSSVTVAENGDGSFTLAISWPGCLQLSSTGHWYGGPPMGLAKWPASNHRIVEQQWRSNDMLADRGAIGSVLDGLWLTSCGAIIRLSPAIRFATIAFNDPVESGWRGALRIRPTRDLPVELDLSAADDVRSAHQALLARLPRPTAPQPPSLEMMRSPIWSTWARFKMAVDQASVEAYAMEIVERGFPRSHLEIDDKWCSRYGDFQFDAQKFPDPAAMVRRLRAQGFTVTLWITPFAELESEAFAEGAAQGHWITEEGSGRPAIVRWWQGDGVLLNVSDSEACAWMEGRLRRLQEATGVSGFKFDAGEGVFVPPRTAAAGDANQYAEAWARFAARFGGGGEVRAAGSSQGAGVWTREFDKDSTWSEHNGLKALVTTAMLHGVLGYPFVLPDMVGGNAYSEEMAASLGDGQVGTDGGGRLSEEGSELVASSLFFGEVPEKELYTRWCFATALLPAVQFSIAPWQYDSQAEDACRKALELREHYLPELEALAARALTHGEPLVRPLWWYDPHDEECLTVDDEFMLGDATLVAPVLACKATSRRVYLPRGSWEARGHIHAGPVWVEAYPVALDELAVFRRV